MEETQMESWGLGLSIVVFLLQGVICGALSSHLAASKERSSGAWFALGFFFGPLGLLAAVGLPDNKRNKVDSTFRVDSREFVETESHPAWYRNSVLKQLTTATLQANWEDFVKVREASRPIQPILAPIPDKPVKPLQPKKPKRTNSEFETKSSFSDLFSKRRWKEKERQSQIRFERALSDWQIHTSILDQQHKKQQKAWHLSEDEARASNQEITTLYERDLAEWEAQIASIREQGPVFFAELLEHCRQGDSVALIAILETVGYRARVLLNNLFDLTLSWSESAKTANVRIEIKEPSRFVEEYIRMEQGWHVLPNPLPAFPPLLENALCQLAIGLPYVLFNGDGGHGFTKISVESYVLMLDRKTGKAGYQQVVALSTTRDAILSLGLSHVNAPLCVAYLEGEMSFRHVQDS